MTVPPPPAEDEGLSSAEAAARLGTSERTLRERIKHGKIHARKVFGPYGNAVYRVYLDALPPTEAGSVPAETSTLPSEEAYLSPPPMEGTSSVDGNAAVAAAVAPLAAVIDRLNRENVELAGRVGFLQAEVLHLKDRIELLEMPKEAQPEVVNHPTPTENRPNSGSQQASGRSRWRRWLGFVI